MKTTRSTTSLPKNSGSRRLTISKLAQKALSRRDEAIRKMIDEQIQFIGKNPFSGEKLVGDLKGYWSCHVGGDTSNLVIVYTIEKKRIHIVGIGTHKLYQKLGKMVRKSHGKK